MDPRRAILEYLADPKSDNRFSESYLIASISQRNSFNRSELWEALWSLIADGLIFINPSGQWSSKDNWRWDLTSAGKQATDGGSWEPRDADGFLKRLRRHRPAVDRVAVVYVVEALRAFNARGYLATSVMLGVASERMIQVVAEGASSNFGDTAAKLRKVLDNPRTSAYTRFSELRRLLEHHRASIPDELIDPILLDGVAHLLRVARNQAGHPTGSAIDEETARAHLVIGGTYLQKMATLEAHLRVNEKHDC